MASRGEPYEQRHYELVQPDTFGKEIEHIARYDVASPRGHKVQMMRMLVLGMEMITLLPSPPLLFQRLIYSVICVVMEVIIGMVSTPCVW
jgi:hypothetical protein